MDACNIAAIVNLDGRWGDELTANLERYDCAYPGRFFTFCHVDWSVLQNSATCEKALVHGLEQSVRAGAGGLKVWKDLGLSVRDADNKFVLPDDARLDALWDAAGRLGIPVAIHTADPLAFFDPVNNSNERLEQLLAHPEWSYHSPIYPKFEQLIKSLENVVAAHRLTTFIGLHVGCYAENLEWVSRMLDRYGRNAVTRSTAAVRGRTYPCPRRARASTWQARRRMSLALTAGGTQIGLGQARGDRRRLNCSRGAEVAPLSRTAEIPALASVCGPCRPWTGPASWIRRLRRHSAGRRPGSAARPGPARRR